MCQLQDRDPATLLPVLAQSLQEHAMLPHRALFVPPDSSYTSLSRVGKQAVDTSWQRQQRDVWDAQLVAVAAAAAQVNRPHAVTVEAGLRMYLLASARVLP